MIRKRIITLALFIIILKVEAQTSTFSAIDSLFAKGRYKLALSELNKMEPSFLTEYKKAVIYESVDNYREATKALENAISFKDDENTKLKLAKNYRSLNQHKKAIKIYEDILQTDSLNLVLQYQLGKLYFITRNPKKAKETFDFLIKNDPENPNYSYHLGLTYALMGKRDPMINSFIDTYKKDTLHIKAIERLAESFQKLNDEDSTQLFVDKGLRIAPNNNDLNRLKINQLYRVKKYAEALPYLLHIDSLPQNDTYTKTMLGRTYYNLDSLDKAKAYFKTVTRLDDKDYKAYTYLGHISQKHENFDYAYINYSTALFVGKESRDEEYYGLATVFFKTNKIPDAIKMFEKAYQENRGNYRALYQQAKLSDDYYKDKKIAFKLYQNYIERFWEKDEVMADFVRKRIKEIKYDYLQKGEILR